jgi:hypothetical protein
VNDEFERIRMEAVVVSVKVLPRYLPGGNEERHRKLQSGQSPGRYLNSGPPEYKAGMLTTRPRRSTIVDK